MSSTTAKRDARQGVQMFDVDLFRNKLENYMRKQSHEMCEVVNNKKRKLEERNTETDKEDMDLIEDWRDDVVFQFGKKARSEEELECAEVSPLALPSPLLETAVQSNAAWPDLDHHPRQASPESMIMRRQMSGYSEASLSNASTYVDDSWMSPCPPLSRACLSSSSSVPQTPGEEMEAEIEQSNALHAPSFEDPYECLDLSSMQPHEINVFAALEPEKFKQLEKAALIKKAFRQSDKLLNQFAKERSMLKPVQVEMHDTAMEDFDMEEFLYVS